MARHDADTTQQEQLAIVDRLYERYGKPLEAQHRGEYLAVSKDGRTLLAPSLPEVVEEATEKFGPENYIFKVGDKAVGKWARISRTLPPAIVNTPHPAP